MHPITEKWDKDHNFTQGKDKKIPKGRPCDWCGLKMGKEKGYIHKICLEQEAKKWYDII